MPSPFAPKEKVRAHNVEGVLCASTCCGFYKHKEDLCVFKFTEGTSVAGVFTKSGTASPPVLVCRENLKFQKASALVVNSGNSFAMTGKKGKEVIDEVILQTAKEFDVPKNEVFVCSTGVIGILPNIQKIIHCLPKLKEELSSDVISQTAETIMTTDTYPKVYSVKFQIDGREVTLSGIAKGSGMIEPNMATMLSFIFTDAKIPSSVLQKLTEKSVELTFNSITVDSDTSTSDSLLVFATNKVEFELNDENLKEFAKQLHFAMESLAKQIIMDGEGISKLVTVNVVGAKSYSSAKIVAKAIANSPLVKTAITGNDPNWGRIAMAIGKTNEEFLHERLKIQIGKYTIYEDGEISPSYVEEEVYYYMRGAFVEITVELGVGNEKATVWGCNLTNAYVEINADYRS